MLKRRSFGSSTTILACAALTPALPPCSLQSQLDASRAAEEAVDAELEKLRERVQGLRQAKGQADSEYRNMEEHLRELQGSSKSNVRAALD
jgi:hypothetical protein